MTPPEPAGAAREADAWAGEIDAFAALLDQVERQLGDGAWDSPLPTWTPPRSFAAPPTAAELARARELLDRAQRCRAELESQLQAAAAGVDDLGRRRDAVRRYGATP